jgi:hypothetical protein
VCLWHKFSTCGRTGWKPDFGELSRAVPQNKM